MQRPSIFKYKKGRKIGEIGITALIISLLVFLLDSNGSELFEKIAFILIAVFLVAVFSYIYLFNEQFEIAADAIFINKKIGKSTKISFDKIRSVTIREEKNSVGRDHLVMNIFATKNTRIIVSDLMSQFKMIQLIGEAGKSFGFKVIHEQLNPKTNTQ